MPGSSGLDLTSDPLRPYPALPVLYISGYPAGLIAADGILTDERVQLLMKPFTSEQLFSNVVSGAPMLVRGATACLTLTERPV